MPGPSSDTACTSTSPDWSRGASTGIGSAPGEKSARPAGSVTAPAAGAAVDQLRFARLRLQPLRSRLLHRVSAASPTSSFDFVFHTGDYIYEGRADGGRNPAVVRQHRGAELYTLVDYRNRYALYKADRDLLAAHASAPFVVTWDDHEVDNDYAGDIDENDTPPEVFLLRRAAAYQAYYETMPSAAVDAAGRAVDAALSPPAVRPRCST